MIKKIIYIHNSNFETHNANQIQVTQFCNSLILNKIKVDLIIIGKKSSKIKKKYDISDKINLKLVKSSKKYYINTIKLFFEYLKNHNKKSIVYTRDLVLAILIKKIFRKTIVIYEIHEVLENKIWKILIKKAEKILNLIISVNKGIKKDLKIIGLKCNNTKVIVNGVKLEKFDLKIDKMKTREKLNLNKVKNLVTYIGGFEDWKGYKTLLKASELIQNKNIEIVMIGGEKDKIKILKKKYKKVNFQGIKKSSEIPTYLKAFDIAILPNIPINKNSTYYTCPIKLFEYLASKTPIIASDLPSIRNIVNNKQVEFFKPNDEKELALKIEKLVHDKEKIEMLQNSGFEKVKGYTIDKKINKIFELLRN